MSEDNNTEKTTISFTGVIGWLIGVAFLAAGVVSLANGVVLSGIISLGIPLFSIPMLANKWQDELGIEISTGMTFLLVVVLLILTGVTMPSDELSNDAEQNDTANTEQVSDSNDQSPTTTNESARSWETVATFSGGSGKSTEPFTIDADRWRVSYDYDGSMNFIVDAVPPGGSSFMGESIVNALEPVDDVTNVYEPGEYYLDITATGPYEIVVEAYR
jgi:hypothetical protein